MAQSPIRFLPPDVDPTAVRATLGLVSDTHMGQRLAYLPPELSDILADVDLILHAGDVGTLSVLDQLSAIAPVVAVQGNDDSDDAKTQLPVQTVVAVGGQRVLVWHSHYLDPILERESRTGDDMPAKLVRTVDQARVCGASLAVFGHWHIPLVWDAGDLLVVNPGALASANEISRQRVRTVAIAWLLDDDTWHVRHVALDDPTAAYDPAIDWERGFFATSDRFTATILDPAMRIQMPLFKAALPEELIDRLRTAIGAAARRVWAGEAPLLTWRDIEREALAAKILSPAEEAQLRALVADFGLAKDTHA